MADDKNLSPEERLFRAIHEEKKSSPAKSAGKDMIGTKPAAGGLGEGMRALGGMVKGIFSAALLSKGGPKTGGKEVKPLFASPIALQGIDTVKNLLVNGVDLNIVNRFFILALVGLMAAAGHYALQGKASTANLMEAVSKIKFERLDLGAVEPFQPAEYYLEQVQQRDIFNPIQKVEKPVIVDTPKPEPPPPPPPKPQLKDMAKGLKVVGIAWGASPKAMIKDESTQEIFFLKEGDTIGKTQISVKALQRDKVVIGYEEEEMDLF